MQRVRSTRPMNGASAALGPKHPRAADRRHIERPPPRWAVARLDLKAKIKSMVFKDAEIERYARHLVLREVGGPGQQKLKAARVLIVGVGGLGSPTALYLAAAGVGTLILVDPDAVDASNLQRQILYSEADIGRPKAEAAADRLAQLNSHILSPVSPTPLIIRPPTNYVEGSIWFWTEQMIFMCATPSTPRACDTISRSSQARSDVGRGRSAYLGQGPVIVALFPRSRRMRKPAWRSGSWVRLQALWAR